MTILGAQGGTQGMLSGSILGTQGGTLRHSRRHPGGTQGTPGGQRRLGGKVCQHMCVFLIKVARPTISRRRERPDPHDLRSLRTKVGGRGPGSYPPHPPPSPKKSRQEPYSGTLFG